MNKYQNKIKLPSNRNFGFFFTFVFFLISIYFYFKDSHSLFYVLLFTSIVFFCTSLFAADILKPLNKLWMRLGLLMGIIISPIVMGVIFFLLFTPISILMRLFGRDELLLRLKSKSSYWIKRNDDIRSNSFRNQF